MNNIPESLINKIETKQDFIKFVESLKQDYILNKDMWENITIDDFLDAMSAWIEDMDGYYQNNNMETPQKISWKVFADILIASKMYE